MFDEVTKYLLEGLAIVLAAWYIPRRNVNLIEILLISLSVTAGMILLDKFAPGVASGARQGMGFNIGLKQVGAGTSADANADANADDSCIPCETPERLYEKCQHKYHECRLKKGKGPRTSHVHLVKEGMDDKMAIDYYSQGMNPDGPISSDNPRRNGEWPVLENMDDEVATSYYSQDMMPESYIPSDEDPHINVMERFDDDQMALEVQKGSTENPEHFNIQPYSETVLSGPSPTPTSMSQGNVQSGGSVTAAERGLVYGKVTVPPHAKHYDRQGNILYSGDLVSLDTNKGHLALLGSYRWLTLNTGSEINQMNKMRFESVKHDNTALTPIRYNDALYLVYNDRHGQTRKINHLHELNVNVSKKHTIFKLVNKAHPDSKDVVKIGDSVLISTDDGHIGYNNSTKRLESGKKVAEATAFKVAVSLGCGPNWRFDQDTRNTKLLNPLQVKQLSNQRVSELELQLQRANQRTDALMQEKAKSSSSK